MPTIDVQVYAYERNHPRRPWVGVSGEVVAAMDAVGVDGAILVSPLSLYRYAAWSRGRYPAPVILFTVAQSVKFLVYSHRCGHWGRDPSLGYSPQVWRHQTFW